jgi:hypothetical protein
MRRQHRKTPVSDRTAGISPNKVHSASANQPNLPKWAMLSQPKARSAYLSWGSTNPERALTVCGKLPLLQKTLLLSSHYERQSGAASKRLRASLLKRFWAVAKRPRSPQFHRKNADCDAPFAVWQFLNAYDLSNLLTAQGVIRIEIARDGDLHTGKVLP